MYSAPGQPYSRVPRTRDSGAAAGLSLTEGANAPRSVVDTGDWPRGTHGVWICLDHSHMDLLVPFTVL